MKTWSTPPVRERERMIPCALCGGEAFRPALDCGSFRYVRCRRCGLLQRNPQTVPEDVAARYREKHGDNYLSYELANEDAFLSLQQMALADVQFGEVERRILASSRGEAPAFLDVGCATGALLAEMSGRGWAVAGAELCGPSAEYAARVRGLDVRCSSIEEARFDAESFDVVHASHLIEHLNDPRAFAREAFRVLRGGGRFFVTTPNADGFQARLFGPAWRSAIFDHLYLFGRRDLLRLLAEEGFRTELVSTWGGLAKGAAPAPVKAFMDRAAKRWGFGDVMIVRAEKPL